MNFFEIIFLIYSLRFCSTFESKDFLRSSSFHHAIELISNFRRPISKISFEEFLTISSLKNLIENRTKCHEEISILEKSFFSKEIWALKTIDAWGTKVPAGILDGSHLWLGSYDECRNFLYSPKNRSDFGQPFPTHFCTISKSFDDDRSIFILNSSFIVGLCLPQSCRSENFRQNSIDLICPEEFRHYSAGFFLTVGLISILILFVCLSTFVRSAEEFSFVSTLRKIFSNFHRSNLNFLNGIRSFSLLWIILGHSYVFQLTIADNLVSVIRNFHRSILTQIVFGAVFAVDNFFFLSGFLSVGVILKKFSYGENFRFLDLIFHYVRRYFRLIPTLIFVLLISLNLSSELGDGPLFPTKNGFELTACSRQWWSNLLFINNLYKPETSCLPVTWYLANDFQFHLLAPLLLLPFIYDYRRTSYFLIVTVLISSNIISWTIVAKNPGFEFGFVANDVPSVDFFEKFYIAPWCRIGPFLIGILTKLFLEQFPRRFSTLTTIIFSSISILLAIFSLFFPFYSDGFSRTFHIFYQSSSHLCWSIAFSWFVIFCYFYQSTIINKVLSFPIWLIIARLAYSAYLVHTLVILTEVYNRSSTIHYQTSLIFNGFVGQTFLTFIVSLIIVILVESPASIMEKRIRHISYEKARIFFRRSSYEAIN